MAIELRTQNQENPTDAEKNPEETWNWKLVSEGANNATQAEHDLTVRQALKTHKKSVLWALAISIAIIMDGYDGALVGNFMAFPSFQLRFGVPHEGKYVISTPWQVAFSMSTPVGRVLAAPIAGWSVSLWGRKNTMIVNLFIITGFIFIQVFANSIGMLCAAQFLVAIVWGVYNTIVPTYISEICPVVLRGVAEAWIDQCWVIGQFISIGVLQGLEHRRDDLAWKIPFCVQFFWPVLLIFLLPFAPESPWWLVRKGKFESAEHSLKRLSDDSDHEIKQTVAMMIRTNQLEEEESEKATYWDCFKGTNLRRTEICCAVWSIQSLNGSNMGGTYFFEQAGLDSEQAFKLGVGNTGINCAACLVAIFLIAKYNRFPLFFYGLIVQTVTMWVIGFLGLSKDATEPNISFAQASLMIFWSFAWQISNAPVTYSIIGEVSASRLREKTVSIGMTAYALCIIVMSVATPYMLNPTALNWRGKTSLFYGGLSTLCCLWCWFRLPETKGRTFEELDIMFMKKLSARKFAKYEITEEDHHWGQ